VFGISMWEIGLILIVALIFLGPRQLAETARVVGRWYRELNKMSWDIRNSIDLDSITSSAPSPSRHDTLSESSGPTSPETEDLAAPPAQKTGPDFYGELLESSKEEDEKTPSETPAAAEPEKRETPEEHSARKSGQ